MSEKDTIIIGEKKIIKECNSLLKLAADNKPAQNATIYISFVTDNILINHHNKGVILDANTVLSAINSGYRVVILVRFNNDIKRTLRIIKFILPLVITGKLVVYYFRKYNSINAMKELLVIEGKGAIIGLPTIDNFQIEHAMFFNNKYAINIWSNYYNMIINTYTNPLIHYYTSDTADAFKEIIYKSEESIGDRYTIQYGFNIITLPEDLFARLLTRLFFLMTKS